MWETVLLTGAEQQRLVVVNRVLLGDLTAREGATALGLSVRHLRRILAAYRKEGAAALAHGNRGRTPIHALDPSLGQRVIALAQTTYGGLNDTHLTEVLAEEEGIVLSRSTVRRLRMAAGLGSPRQRRPRVTDAAANAKPKPGCCSSSMPARMRGGKNVVPGSASWPPSTMRRARCRRPSSASRRTRRAT